MKIAICDDLYSDKQRLFHSLNSYCKTNFINVAITEYNSGESLLEHFSKNRFDIIFLDIYMNGLNGIDTAKKIREIDNDCLLVFVTTSREHALDGFTVNALHYLVKPVNDEKTAEVFNRCKKVLNNAQQYIEVISDRLLVKIPVKSIHYIEVYDKACFIHKDLEAIKTYLPLEEIAKQLEAKHFLRCHRSYIVNMRSVVNVEENDFILQLGKRVPIRQSEKQSIKQIYINFLFSLTREEYHVC